MKTATISWIPALLALALVGCEPVSNEGGLLEPYDAGLVQQARLDGPPLAGEAAAAEAERKAAEAAAEAAVAAAAKQADEEEAAAAAADADAAAERRASAAALMAEEEAEIARAEAAAAAAGAVVETVEATPQDAVAAVEPSPNGELALPVVDNTPPGAETAGELAADPLPAASPEPTEVGGAEAPRGLEVLPPSPASDAEALAAIDRAAARPAPPAPDYTSIAAKKSEPCSPEGFDAVPLTDLKLIQTWVEGTASRALLETPGGATRTVTQGSVVGPTGARVSLIGAGEVVFAEIQFDMDDRPVLVQQRLRVVAPR